jgi:hypothetical protein
MSGTAPRETLTPIDDATGRTVYYDEERKTYHTWCDDGTYEPVSTALLLAVSSVLGVEFDDLEALSERVDPDALNELFVHWQGNEPRDEGGSIRFEFAGCAVRIHATGEIVIDPERRHVPSTRR